MMEINFDEKEGKPFSQSEINKLKRDLNAEKFQNIYNIHNNSMTLESNKYNLEEEKNSDNNAIQEQNNDNNNINYGNNVFHSEEINKKHSLNEISTEKENNIKNSESNPISFKKGEEYPEEEIPQEIDSKEQKSQEKFFDLIPLWYTCLNKEHGTKYISLDRKKESLICKYCFQSGALETNLDLNHEFVDKYIKDLEEKNRINNSELSKDIIKETSEENISEREETSHKLNVEENCSNLSNNIQDQINCLTFLCHNFPYFLCETCKDFICYKCISKNMDNNNEKSRHYFHDIESVNYEANSFRDDVNINLDTLETILNSLDFLIEEERKRIKNFRYKIKVTDEHEYYGERLRQCKSFYQCRRILEELFGTWKSEKRFSWRKQFFVDYLLFLKKRYDKYGRFLETNGIAPNKTKEETATIKLTRDIIEAARTPNGGFTKSQLAAIGIEWPPDQDWISKKVGAMITPSQLEAFNHIEYVAKKSADSRQEKKAKTYKDVSFNSEERRKMEAILQAMTHFMVSATPRDITRAISRTTWGGLIKEESVDTLLKRMPEVEYIQWGKYILKSKLNDQD